MWQKFSEFQPNQTAPKTCYTINQEEEMQNRQEKEEKLDLYH